MTDGTTLLGEATTSPYAFTWRGVPAGDYSLAAHAVYDSGSIVASTVASLTVTTPPPPAIALTAPANNTAFTAPAMINLAADVTPNGHTITKVQFYNGATLLGEDSAAPYVFAWSSVLAGNYHLSAQAVYDSGSTVASTAANVTVTNLPPPTIALTSPTNNAAFTAPATINLTANVAANGHAITKVQFYNDTTLLGEDSAAPYAFTWGGITAGTYNLSALAVYRFRQHCPFAYRRRHGQQPPAAHHRADFPGQQLGLHGTRHHQPRRQCHRQRPHYLHSPVLQRHHLAGRDHQSPLCLHLEQRDRRQLQPPGPGGV